MRRSILIALVLLSFSAKASVPTVEGLFRNAHNADISGNTVAVSFTIESMMSEKSKEGTVSGLLAPVERDTEQEDQAFEKKTGHYKLIFSVEENKPTPMLQVRYSGVGMAPSEVTDTFVVPNLAGHIKRERVLEKQFFYSLIEMLVLNSSSGFNALLKKEIQNYKSNKDLIDREKKHMYKKYMTYLKRKKELDEEDEKAEELVSPFKPEDENKREEVEKLRSRRFYKDYGNVRLTREGEKFYWSIELVGLNALFTQEEHRLKKLSLDTLQGALKVSAANYVLMDGRHELPQKVIMDHPEYGRYQVTFMSTQDFKSKSTSFSDRVQEYRSRQQKNLKQENAKQRESFGAIPYLY